MNNWSIEDTAKVMLLARLSLEAESSREAFKRLTAPDADLKEEIMCRFSDTILKQNQQDHIVLGIPPIKLATCVWQISRIPKEKKTAVAFACPIIETDPEMMNEKKDPAQCYIFPQDKCCFDERDEEGNGVGTGRLDSNLLRGMPRKALDELINERHGVTETEYGKQAVIKNRLYVDEEYEIPFLVNFFSMNPLVRQGESPVWFNMMVLLHKDEEGTFYVTEWQPYVLSHVKSKLSAKGDGIEAAQERLMMKTKETGSYYMKKWDIVQKELDATNVEECTWWSWLQEKLQVEPLVLTSDTIPLIEKGFSASPSSWKFPQTLRWRWLSDKKDFSPVVISMADAVTYFGVLITSEVSSGMVISQEAAKELEKKKGALKGVFDQFRAGAPPTAKVEFAQNTFKMPHYIQEVAVERSTTVDLTMMQNRSSYEKPVPSVGKQVDFPQEMIDKYPQLAESFFNLVGKKRPASETSTAATAPPIVSARQRVGENKGKVKEVLIPKETVTPSKSKVSTTPAKKGKKTPPLPVVVGKTKNTRGRKRLQRTAISPSQSEAEVSGTDSGDEGEYDSPVEL